MSDLHEGTKTDSVVNIINKKISFIYHVSHFIKSFGNNFINSDIEIGNKNICFKKKIHTKIM